MVKKLLFSTFGLLVLKTLCPLPCRCATCLAFEAQHWIVQRTALSTWRCVFGKKTHIWFRSSSRCIAGYDPWSSPELQPCATFKVFWWHLSELSTFSHVFCHAVRKLETIDMNMSWCCLMIFYMLGWLICNRNVVNICKICNLIYIYNIYIYFICQYIYINIFIYIHYIYQNIYTYIYIYILFASIYTYIYIYTSPCSRVYISLFRSAIYTATHTLGVSKETQQPLWCVGCQVERTCPWCCKIVWP